MTHKAVILARGLGKRMRKADEKAKLDEGQSAVAETGVKALIPIDRPFLDYVLGALADAGYRHICLVIGPEHHQIRKYYGQDLQPERLEFSFAIQSEPKGTADAVAAAEVFADGDEFVVINSDTIYPPEALAPLREISGSGLAAFGRKGMLKGSNITPEGLSAFAIADIAPDDTLRRIIEKPDKATLERFGDKAFLSMNCWRFGPSIFEACRKIEPSPRGELEITDAVQLAMDELGETFHVVRAQAPVLDMSCRGDIEEIRKRLAGREVHL